MTDIEMTRLCAEAMGDGEAIARPWPRDGGMPTCYVLIGHDETYDPLHDDAQAMALAKKFRLDIYGADSAEWGVQFMFGPNQQTNNPDLNRAIVECVAKMQAAKAPQ